MKEYFHIRHLGRNQIAALIASVIDFMVLFALMEVGQISYLYSIISGAVAGAAINFSLNKYWVFPERDSKTSTQAGRYSLVSLMSLVWNVILVYCLGQIIPYYWAKLIVAILVGLIWNYPLQKFWVFREGR